MKAIKILFNVLGILLAALLSLLLVATLITTPLVSTAASFLKSETLYKAVKNIDFTYFLNTTDATQVNPELLNELLETEFAEDVITLYVDSLFEALGNNTTNSALTTDDIMTLANKHFPELLSITKNYIGTDLPVTDDQIQTYTLQYISKLAPDIIGLLPTLGDLGISNTIMNILYNLYTGKTVKFLQFIIGLLSILVLVCRFPRFKGFMWLGITYLGSSLLLFLMAFVVKTTGISLFTELIPFSKIIVAPFFSGLTSGVFKGAGIIFGLAITFIAIFIMGRKLFCQKQAKVQMVA